MASTSSMPSARTIHDAANLPLLSTRTKLSYRVEGRAVLDCELGMLAPLFQAVGRERICRYNPHEGQSETAPFACA